MNIPEPLLEAHLSADAPLRQHLNDWARTGHVPQSFILLGLPGVGKRTLAHWLTHWLSCTVSSPKLSSGEGSARDFARPCGACSSCLKLKSGSFVDFVEIAADSEAAVPTIKVDQLRSLLAAQGFQPHEAPYRVIFIRDAETLTLQSANALLKTLEEPPPNWVFILSANDLSAVLPTIRSRCQSVRLKPLADASIEALLIAGGIAASPRRQVAVRLAQGSWGRALALCGETAWTEREQVATFVERPKDHWVRLVDWASQDSKRVAALVDHLETIVRDLSLPLTPPQPWLNEDLRSKLNRVQKTPAAWSALAERLAQARIELGTPMNRKLLVQDLLMPWLT